MNPTFETISWLALLILTALVMIIAGSWADQNLHGIPPEASEVGLRPHVRENPQSR